MPGLVVFKRRWSVGSDDLVVPGVFLFILHSIWAIIVIVLVSGSGLWRTEACVALLRCHLFGYLAILVVSLLLELLVAVIAMRGSILETEPRAPMPYLLYARLGVLLLELVWLGLGASWLVLYYADCPLDAIKDAMLGLVVCNCCVLASVAVTVWCTYDAAGRSWVKMKQYQRSMKEGESKFQYRRSGSRHRNWRQRKVIRAYQDSWDHRCRLLFCCMGNSDRSRNSFADIARLLSDFFRDLDVVPSDVIAGLVLLRKLQKAQREAVVAQRHNDTYEFLSGVAVTPRTEFVALGESDQLEDFRTVVHYMRFALGAYGWPMFLVTHSACGLCKLCANLRCTCLPRCGRKVDEEAPIVEDNCCNCNMAALREQVERGAVEVVFATYHVDVGQTPFFVALDYERRKVVISIRGTLSMKDVITDLNAEGEPLPLSPPREDWLGHKGMVQAAQYIRDKIKQEGILGRAFARDTARGTHQFELVLVGHSLGAGTAAILAILLRQEHPALRCYAFSPPGGLLSMPAVKYSQEFTISVVVGKDVVPRIGLHQLESLRADLINAIKQSTHPKWRTIAGGMGCCCSAGAEGPESRRNSNSGASDAAPVTEEEREMAREVATHPSDSSIALTVHQPLYPPGKIMHIVRHHPSKGEQKYEKRWRQFLRKNEPVFQALWANNTDFNEVLISPVMIQDHMPDKVLEALNKVMTNIGPAKPQRVTSPTADVDGAQRPTDIGENALLLQAPGSPKLHTPPHKLCLETSFTSLSPDQPGQKVLSPNGNPPQTPSPYIVNPKIPWEYTSLLDDQVTKVEVDLPKVDLIRDDWYGLAPLATPETLSEVSSVSSRTSSLLHGIAAHYPMLFSPRMGKRIGPVVYKPACLQNSNSSLQNTNAKHFDMNPLEKYYLNFDSKNEDFVSSSERKSLSQNFLAKQNNEPNSNVYDIENHGTSYYELETKYLAPNFDLMAPNSNFDTSSSIFDSNSIEHCKYPGNLVPNYDSVQINSAPTNSSIFDSTNNESSTELSFGSAASTPKKFQHSPKQVTFNLINNNLDSAHLYFVTSMEGSPDEDSGIGTVSGRYKSAHNDVSPLPLLSSLGESYDFVFNNGESSV